MLIYAKLYMRNKIQDLSTFARFVKETTSTEKKKNTRFNAI